ncbi:hypothetical protein KAZ66_04140 [Candidatus Woesebacteria bacterium]|nr:hypothetical protein [Candidatus Woesebacteria bacterium]
MSERLRNYTNCPNLQEEPQVEVFQPKYVPPDEVIEIPSILEVGPQLETEEITDEENQPEDE